VEKNLLLVHFGLFFFKNLQFFVDFLQSLFFSFGLISIFQEIVRFRICFFFISSKIVQIVEILAIFDVVWLDSLVLFSVIQNYKK